MPGNIDGVLAARVQHPVQGRRPGLSVRAVINRRVPGFLHEVTAEHHRTIRRPLRWNHHDQVVVGVTAAGVLDRDDPVAEVDVGPPDRPAGWAGSSAGAGHLNGVGPVTQRLIAKSFEPGGQRQRNRRRGVDAGVGKPGRTQDVVEMMVGHDQVRDRTAGQVADIAGDGRGFLYRRAGVDQQRTGPAVDESDRDIEKGQPAAVYATGQFLPVVVHHADDIVWTHVQNGCRSTVSMRIALLSYRSKTHCGGQGVYVRHLSRGLVELGHRVEVFSGPPYPDQLDPRVRLTEVPSLDLYRDADPFRTPRPGEIKDRIDLLELATMWTAGFPEPRTFSLRVARLLTRRNGEFDVVHDNQCLGTGLLDIAGSLPVVATVHHPITRDRTVDLAASKWWRKPLVHRWYGFLGMQKRVARRIPDLLTVSSSSAEHIAEDFEVHPDQLHTVPLGVDTELFAPSETPRVAGRIVAIASADRPLKGIANLLHAIARLRAHHDVELQLVAKLEPNGPTEKLISELGISDIVRVSADLPDTRVAALLASAEIACIPSLYEGFSLPAVEAMASGTPIVASRAGALPEVLSADGMCADLVGPGDVGALTAALGRLLDSPERRRRLGAAGRRRALEIFSWESVAAQTVRVYEQAIARRSGLRRTVGAVDEPC